jgi:hypothetical protein
MVDISQLLTALITTVVALAGWLAVNRLTAWRDLLNHKRKIKTDFLIKAFQDLADASQRPPEKNSPHFRKMESAVASIQLFGNDEQIKQIEQFMNEFSESARGPLDPILNSLRNDLRHELGLPKVVSNGRWFRPENGPQK